MRSSARPPSQVRTGSQFRHHNDHRTVKSVLVHDAVTTSQLALSSMPQIRTGSHRRHIVVLAAAVAALLAQAPARALSLGPVELQSHLGEPLRAEIPLGLAPGERILPTCVSLATDATAGARPATAYDARLRITGTGPSQRLLIDGRLPLREPIVDLAVRVRCSGLPILERDYMLMLTPAVVAAMRSPSSSADRTRVTSAQSGTVQRSPAVQPTSSPPQSMQHLRPAATVALRGGEPYRVAPGDTLSTIAQRVTDRQASLWDMAEAIFAANPEAFIGGDRNRIRAGALIELPSGAATRPSTTSGRTLAGAQSGAQVPVVTEAAALTDTQSISSTMPQMSSTAASTFADTPLPEPSVSPDTGSSLPAGLQTRQQTTVDTASSATVSAEPPGQAAEPAAPAGTAAGEGLLRWLAGLLVGLGFISLGGLLAWTALRRRPEPDAPVDLEETGRATRLAPPPSFDPGLMGTGAIDLRTSGIQVEEATDEVETLKAADAPGIDFDELFSEAAQSHEVDASAHPHADAEGLDVAVDDPLLTRAEPAIDAVPQAPAAPELNVEGTGSFSTQALTLGPRPSGETTVEHRFAGFGDTQALELQMTEAMAMLEQDYTSRFEAAVSVDDTGSLEATDTLHGVPAEVMRSLKELEAQAEGDESRIEDAATAILPVPEIGAEAARDGGTADEALPDDDEPTALLEPPGKVNTG